MQSLSVKVFDEKNVISTLKKFASANGFRDKKAKAPASGATGKYQILLFKQ